MVIIIIIEIETIEILSVTNNNRCKDFKVNNNKRSNISPLIHF